MGHFGPQTRKQPLLSGTVQTPPMDRHADLVAPCGMNCGTCSRYLAGTRDIRKFGVRMPNSRGCCPGTKSCAFLKRQCRLLTEGTVTSCSLCPGFPCKGLGVLDKRYQDGIIRACLKTWRSSKTREQRRSYQKKRRSGSALPAVGQSPATTGSVLTAVLSGKRKGL